MAEIFSYNDNAQLSEGFEEIVKDYIVPFLNETSEVGREIGCWFYDRKTE